MYTFICKIGKLSSKKRGDHFEHVRWYRGYACVRDQNDIIRFINVTCLALFIGICGQFLATIINFV